MRYKVVDVHWDDAAREIGWRDPEEDFSPHFFVHSIGLEIRNDDEFVTVTRDVSLSHGGFRDMVHVPKKMIKRRRVVGYVEIE